MVSRYACMVSQSNSMFENGPLVHTQFKFFSETLVAIVLQGHLPICITPASAVLYFRGISLGTFLSPKDSQQLFDW